MTSGRPSCDCRSSQWLSRVVAVAVDSIYCVAAAAVDSIYCVAAAAVDSIYCVAEYIVVPYWLCDFRKYSMRSTLLC